MMLSAILRCCPIATSDLYEHPERISVGRTFYGRALRLHADGVPLCVDHDIEQRVGTVHTIFEIDDTGSRPWFFARATVEDPPVWFGLTTRASVAAHGFQVQPVGAGKVVVAGLLKEVSLVSPSLRPAEPSAGVVRLSPLGTSTPTPATRAPVWTTPRVRPSGPAALTRDDVRKLIQLAALGVDEDRLLELVYGGF